MFLKWFTLCLICFCTNLIVLIDFLFSVYQCLKESVVKALGEGIGFGLDRLEFHLNSYPLTNDQNVTDTVFYLDGKVNQFWTFEETLLNSDHCVVVGYNFNNSDEERISNLQCNHTSHHEINKTDDNSKENVSFLLSPFLIVWFISKVVSFSFLSNIIKFYLIFSQTSLQKTVERTFCFFWHHYYNILLR